MLNEKQNNSNTEEIDEDNSDNLYQNENENTQNNENILNKSLVYSKNIKVFCRFRPPNEIELSHSITNSVIILSPKKFMITQKKDLEIKQEYTFNNIFDIDCPKDVIYNKSCKQLISLFLEGYDTSLICYGETGTGKTYTIKQLIPLIISQIFNSINESDTNNELFKIEVSAFEIYKEQINDLIDKKNKNLNLIKNKIDNLTNIGVSSENQMMNILKEVIKTRREKDEHNSKSHFIINIKLSHFLKKEKCMINSQLFLVDLEGSERISKNYKNDNISIEEQKLINKSLIALSIIVNNLTAEKNNNENEKVNYAPYRDSKLTRILSEAIGGNCYTNIILTCSKNEYSSLETRNTLMFGEKIKSIINKPIIGMKKIEEKKNLFLSEIAEEENIDNDNESANENNDINTKDILGTEIKFLKIQIQQLKDIIKQDKIFMEDLNERNRILEQEKKNLMAELEDTIIQSRKDEKKDTINSEYIENNINDIHELLNEKEIKEKNMNDEIYNLKLILEKNKLEYNEIINTKNIELKKILEEKNNFMQTFQELMNCLEQASLQIQEKDKKIEELLNSEFIKKLNEEKNILIKKNSEYDNKLKVMNKLINKMKEEIENKNDIIIQNEKLIDELNMEVNNSRKKNENELIKKTNLLNENNLLKNKNIKYENDIKIINNKNKALEETIIKIKEENNIKLNELKTELDTKTKIGIVLHNLKIKYQNLTKKNNDIINENKTLKESIKEYNQIKSNLDTQKNENINNLNIINELKKEIKTKNEIIEQTNEKLRSELNIKNNELENNKIIFENHFEEINSYKNLINKLKKENASLNNIIIDIKSKISTDENKENNYIKKIQNFEKKLESKEYIIHDYKAKYEQILKENIINKNIITDLEKNNSTLLKNFDILKQELNNYQNDTKLKEEKIKANENIEIIKEGYIKEIENYEDIIKQKDIIIDKMNKEIIESKFGIEKILSLQREISELKVENNQLYLKIKEYEKNENENKKKDNSKSKEKTVLYLINNDVNKDKIKKAYRTLIQENELLKNNIIKLKEYQQ